MVFRLWLQRSPRLLGRAFLLVGGVEMKKILFSFLLASSFFYPSSAQEVYQPTVEEILNVLQSWAETYPQCYENVAYILDSIDVIRSLLPDHFSDFLSLSQKFSSYSDNVSSYLENFSKDSGAIQGSLSEVISQISAFHGDFSILHSELGYHLPSYDNYLNQILQLISEHFSKLPDFGNWSPNVHVSNYIDLKEVLRELFGEIIVNCHLDADPSINVKVDFDFNYDYFLPIKQLNDKANKSYFSLNPYTRYIPYTWIYKSDDSMDYLINPMQNSAGGVDFLDFLCACGNALVQQNEDISVLLCQMLGFFKSGHEDFDQLKQMATSAADDASKDLDSLKSAFNASSVDAVASAYFVDLNIDDKFDSNFLGFAHGSGSSCPDFIDIGPIPFSKIHQSMTDYTLHFSTSGLKSFFDICRQCFTVVWYLFFLTICIFLARFGWAFLKPILLTLTHVLNW